MIRRILWHVGKKSNNFFLSLFGQFFFIKTILLHKMMFNVRQRSRNVLKGTGLKGRLP